MNFLKKNLVVLFVLLFSSTFLFAEEEITTITILNARETSYKKAEETGNDTIMLEGSVILSVQKDNTVTEIKADRVTYDRKTEMLFAEGNVEITTRDSSSGEETTTASSLLLNTSTLEGVFDNGRVVQTQSDALNLPSGSTLIVFSDLFGKGSSNTIAFKNSSLTFCDEEIPHWHIDATRTWLLPGGEFAFFNAFLYVGVVPVLYLPAFYYPKDELIFNPVFGYRKREGYSIQTTTYLWGRKPLDSTSNESSSSSDSENNNASAESLKALYNFVKPTTLKEQKLEGIVLHNLDEDYKGDTSHYVKLLADWYSNLGFMIGVDAKIQPFPEYISKLDFGIDLGFSKTLFRDNATYHPFSPLGNEYKDSSTFLGMTLPFRYSANFDIALSKPFNLSLSIPIYSDPYFAYDFTTSRLETMDWISYFLDNTTNNADNTVESVTEISSFLWQLNSSWSPSIPKVLNPYISNLTFNLSSSVNISSVSANYSELTYEGKPPADYSWKDNTPNRRFYYPSLVTPANLKVSMGGTLFEYPVRPKTNNFKTPDFSITLNKPDELKTEKQLADEAKALEKSEDSKKENKTEEEKSDDEQVYEYYLPELAFTPAKIQVSDGINYKLTYNISADLTTQLAYSSSNLKKSEDFDWNNIRSSMYILKTPATVTSNFNYGGDFFSVVNNISFSPIFQEHPYIFLTESTGDGGYSETEKNTLLLADYNAETRDILNSNTVTLKPLKFSPIFADSSLAWNSNIKVYRRKFIGDAENPEWENVFADWSDQDSITVNSLTGTIVARELDNKFSQSLALTAIMPPLLRQYTANLTLNFPYVTSSFGIGIQELTKENVSGQDKWKKNPFQQGLTVSLFDSKWKISEAFNYNIQDNNPDSLRLSTSFEGLQLSYVMSYTNGYDFDNGWIQRDKTEFLPYSLSISYVTPTKTFYKWFNRISFAPGLNFQLVTDLIKPTDSYMTFSPAITFRINEFLDLTFSSTSKNSILYWYFHDGLYDAGGPFPGNMFKDLIDSFRFDDKAKREGSGFKLKSLNMTLTHALHDWNFNMTVKIEPRLVTENGHKYYDFNPYVSIGIVWKPMESMKTNIIDEYGEWRLE